MSGKLNDCRIAILAVDGFEQVELTEPQRALQAEGAKVEVISQKPGEIQGFKHVDKGDRTRVDLTFEQAKAGDYDAVVLPGGVVNGDAIRMIPAAREFVVAAHQADKPIAVICHGGWLPVSAGIVEGRRMTSWPSLQDDIRNAGGQWVDERVVKDGNLITSRKPDDLDAFVSTLIESLAARPAAGKDGERGSADKHA
ncbi:type 1 glutamine amidotransferase domain-containing protein [Burkholderia glumae]|uniref:Type 1 glutamine amidotransferase n=2 Tax=Burkholderia glumae TaxID=337 RepID=A0AAP9XYI4_BURGL|nr:type 1 glutamine amidotransferase domain-containing protein [Burkholderia glumae]ACR31714.1 Intracellular protease, PfpI family [Burkholderia glumae BGR1]AJY63128.1 intracellular protease, PfpI family protein [Burkholderia glumae LMG 2196 = ATCC 33617]KHJ63867.1 permease [Burkholderia glumae]MCM2485114.1 type 1 glutamine amidotransferase [Burkholderia glumae]MCM2495467.1 type 1 glutamine amidotransferase [Burkholderia glumae]